MGQLGQPSEAMGASVGDVLILCQAEAGEFRQKGQYLLSQPGRKAIQAGMFSCDIKQSQ